jgi:uncharacterized membrane protein
MGRPTQKPVHVYDDETGLERIIFFSDAVFAIAMTLLALEIRLPQAAGDISSMNNGDLLQAILSIWPKYLGYVISFMGIGNYWVLHHRHFRYIQRYDMRLVFINLFLLLLVAFIPFPTAIISENGNRTATIFYALTMALVGLLLFWQWRHATHHHRLVANDLPSDLVHLRQIRTLGAPFIFVLSIILAFIHPDLAKYAWLLILPLILLIQ